MKKSKIKTDEVLNRILDLLEKLASRVNFLEQDVKWLEQGLNQKQDKKVKSK